MSESTRELLEAPGALWVPMSAFEHNILGALGNNAGQVGPLGRVSECLAWELLEAPGALLSVCESFSAPESACERPGKSGSWCKLVETLWSTWERVGTLGSA